MSDSHVLVITGSLVLLISRDVDLRTSADGDVLVALGVTSSDLGALGVERNSYGSARLLTLGLASIVNDGLVVFVLSVGEVHADNIETSITKHLNLLNRVGLGANGTDDRCTAMVLRGLVLGVQGGKPLDLGGSVSCAFEASSWQYLKLFLFFLACLIRASSSSISAHLVMACAGIGVCLSL